MAETDHADGVWTFYDVWTAFPLSRLSNDRSNVIGEFNVGLNSPDGGTYGEFCISFYRFGQADIAARLEAFGDSWKVLASGGLIDALAALDGKPQGPDEVRSLLLSLGYQDRTAKLRGPRPLPCPTCNGRGELS